MSSLISPLPLIRLTVLTCGVAALAPAVSSATEVEWRFQFPLVDDHRVLAAWKCPAPTGGDQATCQTIEIFGDGHLELTPRPASVPPDVLVLPDAVLETLLRSLEPLLLDGVDLAARSIEPPDAMADRIELRLDGIVGRDGLAESGPIHVVRSGNVPAIIFEELGRLQTWLHQAYLAARGGLIWGGFEVGTPICSPAHRLAWGLAVAEPPWCEGVARSGPFDGSEAEREELRGQIRERLRRLPRGRPETGDEDLAAAWRPRPRAEL